MILTLLISSFATIAALSSGSMGRVEVRSQPAPATAISSSAAGPMSRTAFVSAMTGVALVLTPSLAFAAEKEAKKKVCKNCEKEQNSKTCMDLCLYECVKHGGSKMECSQDCLKQCETEKGQRTMATPLTQKGVDYK